MFNEFLRVFKEELISVFYKYPEKDLSNYDTWVQLADTGGWNTALNNAANRELPEINVIRDHMDYLAQSHFSIMITDCAYQIGLISKYLEED